MAFWRDIGFNPFRVVLFFSISDPGFHPGLFMFSPFGAGTVSTATLCDVIA